MKEHEEFYITGEDEFYALVIFRRWISKTKAEVMSSTYGWSFIVDFKVKEIRNAYANTVYRFNGTESWVARMLCGREDAIA